MYIRELTIKSLRSFESAKLELNYPGRKNAPVLYAPNVNLLLGNNGAGKTTVLRAAALAALAPVMSKSAGYVPYNMVRSGEKMAVAKATVELHQQDVGKGSKLSLTTPRQLQLDIRRERNLEYATSRPASNPAFASEMFEDRTDAFLVVGYGATRRVEDASSFNPNEQRKRRVLRYQRVAGLFEPHISLIPLSSWLPALEQSNRGRHTQVVRLIQELMPQGSAFDGKRDPSTVDGDYLFSVRGVDVPFGALSDGYRAYIGWIGDLLYHVCMGAPSGARLRENRGVVLIDEIDLNLHPEWQRTVISTLSRALPNLQFVLTTHSPIVAGSLQRENIFVMEFDERGASFVKQYDERIYGLDAQQVLLSSYFGLATTRAPGAVDEFRDLSHQLEVGRPDIALQMMQRLAGEPVAPVKKKVTTKKAAGRRK